MKTIIIFLASLLFYTNAYGVSEIIEYNWPVEREDNTALPLNELSRMNIYEVDCVTQELISEWPIFKVPPATKFLMQTDKGLICFKFTAVDTEGRESVFSEMVRVGAVNPKSIECVPSL